MREKINRIYTDLCGILLTGNQEERKQAQKVMNELLQLSYLVDRNVNQKELLEQFVKSDVPNNRNVYESYFERHAVTEFSEKIKNEIWAEWNLMTN